MAGQHILLVEDDADLLVVLTQVLEEQGYRVSTASRRDEARELLRRGDVDLIVTDSVLRGGNGDDLVKVAASGNLPIVMISGAPDRIARLSAGNVPFLAKPFHAAELVRLIAQLLS